MSSHGTESTARLSPSVQSLVERKMASPTDAPPPVPSKSEDAPPLYQRTDTGSSLMPVDMPTPHFAPLPVHRVTSAHTVSTSAPTQSQPALPPPVSAPLHTRPGQGEISIPFYSNPPPNPTDPTLGLDKKLRLSSSTGEGSGSGSGSRHREPGRGAGSSSSNEKKSSTFACLTLLANDKLAATNFSPDVVHSVDEVIREKWTKGVAKHAYEDEYWNWQLEGKPWSHGDLATAARELLLAIITRLSQLGYSLHTSLLSSPANDKDSLIFRKTRVPGPERTFFAVSFYKSDRIKVIDCPGDPVKEAITAAIKVWPEGLKTSKEKGKQSRVYSWKLKGTPWKVKSGDGACVSKSRALLCALLEELEGSGWDLVGSIKMVKPDDNRDYTWIFADNVR